MRVIWIALFVSSLAFAESPAPQPTPPAVQEGTGDGVTQPVPAKKIPKNKKWKKVKKPSSIHEVPPAPLPRK
jgi:hypothetical protein